MALLGHRVHMHTNQLDPFAFRFAQMTYNRISKYFHGVGELCQPSKCTPVVEVSHHFYLQMGNGLLPARIHSSHVRDTHRASSTSLNCSKAFDRHDQLHTLTEDVHGKRLFARKSKLT